MFPAGDRFNYSLKNAIIRNIKSFIETAVLNTNTQNETSQKLPVQSKTALAVSALLNGAVFVLAVIGTVLSYRFNGAGMLRFYTVLSNIFGAAACAVLAFFLLRKLTNGKEIPTAAYTLKYMAVCCLTVTFTVVVAALAPMAGQNGYAAMLTSRDMLYHHLLCPVIAAVSFLVFDTIRMRPAKAALIALIPTVVYAGVTIALNAAGIMDGPYPFLRVNFQPALASCLWAGGILGGAYIIALLLAIPAHSRSKSARKK